MGDTPQHGLLLQSAERGATRGGPPQRIQLRPSGRVRFRSTGNHLATFEGGTEGGSAHLQFYDTLQRESHSN